MALFKFIRNKLEAQQAVAMISLKRHSEHGFNTEIENYLKHLIFPSIDTKKRAIDIHAEFLRHFKKQEFEVVKYALDRSPRSISYVHNHTLEVQKYYLSLGNCNHYMEFLNISCQEIADEVLDNNYHNIKYIPHKFQTEDFCWKALKKQPKAIELLHEPTDEMKMYVVDLSPYNIQYIEGSVYGETKPTSKEVQHRAVRDNPHLITYIKKPHIETLRYVIDHADDLKTDDIILFRSKQLVLNYILKKAEDNTIKTYAVMKFGI